MSLHKEIIDAVIDGKIGRDGVVTRQEVIKHFSAYPVTYTGVILSNSEINRSHSPTYDNFTERVGRGRYRIHPDVIDKRKRERGI